MRDEEILKLPKKKALELIYKKYHDDIFRYSHALVGNRIDAEDITSNTFLELNLKIEDFDWRNISIKAWLLKTAKFKFFTLIKKFKKVESENDFFMNLPDINVSVENEAINDSVMRNVKESLKFLSKEEQEIIALRIWEDLKFKEIAEVLDSNSDNVKKKYYRSIGKLKLALSDENIKVKRKELRSVFLIFGDIHRLGIISGQSQNALQLFLSAKLLIPISLLLITASAIAIPTAIYVNDQNNSQKVIPKKQNLNNSLPTPTPYNVFPTSKNEDGSYKISLKYPGEKIISFTIQKDWSVLRSGFRICSGDTNEEKGEYAFIFLYSAKYDATLELNFSAISELKLRPNDLNASSGNNIGTVGILDQTISKVMISDNILFYNSGDPIVYQGMRFTAFAYSGNILSDLGADEALDEGFLGESDGVLRSLGYR